MSNDKVLVSSEEVSKHNTRESCWIIVHGNVYDVTEFLDDHPGGSKIILKYGGKDATEEYEPIHPPDAITSNLPPEKHLGPIDPKTVKQVAKEVTLAAKQQEERLRSRPNLEECLNLHDFEAVAKLTLTDKAWAYYSSAADDEITHRENRAAFQRIWFRPRVLRDVTNVDWSTTILGHKTSLPIYMSATALGKLGHPDGEINLVKAAGKHSVIQMIPTLASCSFDEMMDAAVPGQVQFMQLYVNKDREKTKRIVQRAEQRGVKALFITVDAPQLGRREKDMRMKFEDEGSAVQKESKTKVDRNQGAARAISSFIDPGLSWKDIPWFRSITNMPLILKGVQCWEDAVLAYEHGCEGIVLSNHGGRQIDTSRSGIEVLVEVVDELKKRGMFRNPGQRFEIFVDGGVRRASDVLKAIALGATAVGLGRAFIYASSAYGQEGVEKAIQILNDEFEMNLRLLGAQNLTEVVPSMVDASSLGTHLTTVPEDALYRGNYVDMRLAEMRKGNAPKAKL
ncbi:hypothetical protein FRB95_002258 [Tulasnella sp. JGI-2019a]|nr:hypothetical protein FRB95_002258 [Tulasnella sp. JGI-2019a]